MSDTVHWIPEAIWWGVYQGRAIRLWQRNVGYPGGIEEWEFRTDGIMGLDPGKLRSAGFLSLDEAKTAAMKYIDENPLPASVTINE